MKGYLKYDYVLNGGVLYKKNIDENRHLLWERGGVPAIDASIYDNHRNEIDLIWIRTRKGRIFKIKRDVFDTVKEVIDKGYGRQYIAEKKYWDIRDGKKDEKEKKFNTDFKETKQGSLFKPKTTI